MWAHSARFSGLALLCCVAWGACRPEQASEPTRRKRPVGTLVGHVRLAPGAQLPSYTSLDLVRRPLRVHGFSALPSECRAANEAARSPVQRTTDGLLSGIVVAASDFTRVRERTPRVHKVAIEHCRLQPAIIAATGGDTLSLENRDEFPFEPLIGPGYRGTPLPHAEKVKLPMIPGGIDSILCSLGAPCGRTDLVVFFHPVHGVTDARGGFRIANFPASELVRVSAWHPLFDENETFVWVEPGQQSSIELVLVPKPRFVPQ